MTLKSWKNFLLETNLFNKQNELVSKNFWEFWFSHERKYGRANSISYGNEVFYEYDVDKEKITNIIEEGKNRIVVHTYSEMPMQEKMQYIFLLKK